MTQWDRDLPAIEKQKKEAFNRSIDKQLADMAVNAKKVYTKESYNRKDSWGPANWVCGDHDDIGRAVYLKPSTIVLTGFCY